MKRSAMLQAFRVLRDKPMALLLIVPVQALSVLSVKFMPDMSQMLKSASLGGTPDQTFMLSYMVYMFISSLVGLIGLAATFLLVPPALELFSDGAAEHETQDGWFMRGVRKHWWKPIVAGLIESVPVGIVAIGIYVVGIILTITMAPILASGFNEPSSSASAGTILAAVAAFVVMLGAILLAVLAIKALFALFLPALTDRSIGEAFKLLFSRKGLRKFFRALGGFALLAVLQCLIIVFFGAAYLLLTGPSFASPDSIALALLSFIRSWTGAFAMLLTSLFGVLVYAFQFSLYQQVKDEELAAAALSAPAIMAAPAQPEN